MRNIWGCVIVLRLGEKKNSTKKKGTKEGKTICKQTLKSQW